MAKPRLRLLATVERLRESLWLIPGLMVVFAGALASFLIGLHGPTPEMPFRDLLLPASAEAAGPVLQVVAASVITVTSVVFSLTVVALQITAGNYSPRALRTFLRDLGTQLVLGTFLATFTYAYVLLQNVRSLPGGESEWAPEKAFLVVPLFVVASLIALVFFIHHVTQAVRVDLILKQVLEETLDSISNVHPEARDQADQRHPRDRIPDDATEITSASSGFVQAFGTEDLMEILPEGDLFVAFRPAVGDHILEGGTLAWTWTAGGSADSSKVEKSIREAVQIGRERSMDNDVAYGIRQLVDIAVRALSPGVSDPNTAVATILHLSVAYHSLLTRQVGPLVLDDEHGKGRILIPYPSFAEYLTIMVQQIGHYGRADVMIVLRLILELGELKTQASQDHHEALDQAIDAVLEEAEQGLDISSSLELAREAARDAKEQTFRFRHYTVAG